jgi:hypothetical protein
VDVVKRRYADFAGRVFDRPDVELISDEGRHYLTQTIGTFDVIQLSGVDSLTALSSGAYALVEHYLYTVEAMKDYWRHLSPNGLVSFSRPIADEDREESLRLVTGSLEALEQIGITRPERHLIVISATQSDSGWTWAETLLKKSEFTEPECSAYRRWADQLGFEVLYDPYQIRVNGLDPLIRSVPRERALHIAQHRHNISPITDDAPFFYQSVVWKSLPRLLLQKGGIKEIPAGLRLLFLSLVQILILGLAFIIGPMLRRASSLREVRCKTRVFVYFGALGLGFIAVEIAMLQKYTVFVGGPVYAMAVTLFAILVFSGLGSLLSLRISGMSRRSLGVILLVLVGLICAETMFVNYGVPRLMSLPHGARCLVTVLAVAPLALLMGMPFPIGLRVAQRLGPTIVPWAWGINAVMTTLGSMLCALVSMIGGFTVSLFSAAILYLLAAAIGLDRVHAAAMAGHEVGSLDSMESPAPSGGAPPESDQPVATSL